jgi:threonine/homoserine/homoserine lactone efflux protein
MLPLFLKSLLIGLSIAAPVGPIGLLCIQRTLEHGARVGLATGLGAAVADALYGAIGVMGLGAVLAVLVGARTWLVLAGGLFLVWLGVATLLRAQRPASAAAAGAPGTADLARAFAGTFALTLSNPMTILSFLAVFASLAGDLKALGPQAQAVMVAGVFAGSAAWWLALSATVARLRHRLPDRVLVAIRRASGVLVAGFGLFQLGSVVAR